MRVGYNSVSSDTKENPMIKRLVTKMALGAVLSLGVPAWVSGAELKEYSELTDLQKGMFQMRAVVIAEPTYARELFFNEGIETAEDIEDWDTNDLMNFAGCYADRFLDYFNGISVVHYMGLSDEEIEAYLGNYAFDVGTLCAFEVHEKRSEREAI